MRQALHLALLIHYLLSILTSWKVYIIPVDNGNLMVRVAKMKIGEAHYLPRVMWVE